ncbi:hypothetical protein PRIPAC_94663 [Pristionchus pacificus]|uniref:Uncharacterized protein n=1 Tax=Pristionchus pacificus TaxID=54126 RepID=A0A2A6BQW7_PRIPA|nr:hypothetical protein PRIPAC_94663 [Pristionchus pacificus]|eukprot:PDM68285.1 hypothetical protein PRIPAC_46329 [Pristionchus pacificus]
MEKRGRIEEKICSISDEMYEGTKNDEEGKDEKNGRKWTGKPEIMGSFAQRREGKKETDNENPWRPLDWMTSTQTWINTRK